MLRTTTLRLGFAMWQLLLGTVFAFAPGPLQPMAWGVEAADLAKALDSITTEELKRHVEVLADDTFEGRQAGSRGGMAAGNYLAKAFADSGLAPAGESGSFFQGFNGNCRNILGLVAGSDTALKDEVVVIGAHYDHVGYGRRGNSFGPIGYIHNGADDNASGTAAVLEMIDAIKRLPAAPKRSILFALWDAEEDGLIGSRHWTARPTIPLPRVRFYFNLDMVGRLKNERLEVYGCRTLVGSRRLLAEENGDAKLALDFDWRIKADSDHFSFSQQGIPFLMLHTGLHENYHRPSDDAHLVDHDGIRRVSRLVLQTALRMADSEQIGKYREHARGESTHHQQLLEQSQMPQQPRFGLPWRREPVEPLQIVFLPPSPGSAAEAAGIRGGDRLLSYEGMPIEDEHRFRLELFAARGPKTFRVQREGGAEPLEIAIEPRGNPIRVGITWREDPAEPGIVLLTQVVAGSAADAAGLKVKDRIYAVGEHRFAGSDDFGKLINALPGPLEMLVERQGRLSTKKIEVLPAEMAAP
ncbi:MAG TPA: M20/M25/M40 family metallo-hydrolase [Pirellulaceae bacterium]|nr:M20/M25/M40 family metallo-hydrolase [Pirellulaceae bacterium]